MRKNRRITDLKWNSKKKLKSIRRKLEKVAADWGDTDFFITSQIDDIILARIDEIIEEIDGVDAKSH